MTAMVSAVSPDWEMRMSMSFCPMIGFRYRNSDAISTSTGMRRFSSNMCLPMRHAWYEVPQAIIHMRLTLFKGGSFRSSKSTSPRSSFTLPRSVSEMALGCSKISFNMKCL